MMKNTDYGDNLKQSGLKNTKRRIAILDILEQSDQPIAAEQVFLN
jgi:Fur family ferric uptake transcriptional regulator